MRPYGRSAFWTFVFPIWNAGHGVAAQHDVLRPNLSNCGALAISHGMVRLWSPDYFIRLWCVYGVLVFSQAWSLEFFVFRTANYKSR